MLALAQAANEAAKFETTFMISATKGDGVADVRQWLAAHVPQGPWHYPEDEVSDAPVRQLASEITREKLYLKLHQELPYQSTVETESWTERKDGSVRIEQTIYVERDSQKKIVLGKAGQSIKAIGEAARRELADILEKKVHLFLFVKVREGWGDDPERYRQMGLEFPKGMMARAGMMALALLAGSIAAGVGAGPHPSAHQRGRDRRGAARRRGHDRRSARGVRAGAEKSAGARAGLSDRELFLFPLHPERRRLRRQHPARRRRPRPGQGQLRLQRDSRPTGMPIRKIVTRCSGQSRASRWRRPRR